MNAPITMDKFDKAEKRVVNANRRQAERDAYRSPSIEEIAARAHARSNPVIRGQAAPKWEMIDYVYAFHGAALIVALVWHFLF